MNNLKNIALSVVNDDSTGQIKYYFDGKEHPFVQLNASGAGNNDPDAEIVLKGNADRPVRELVGLFDASVGGASWSVDGSWTNPDPRYALDASDIWNGAMELAKETVVSTGGYVGKYVKLPETKEQASKAFFPSKGEYEANPIVAGKVYSACGCMVWSRSASGNFSAWYIDLSTGDLNFSYGVIYVFACAPAFNLDLSKILMVRRAYSDENVRYIDKNIPYKACSAWTDTEVKFLAMTDDVDLTVNVIKRSDEYIEIRYMTTAADNTHTYLSSIITDEDGNILYYNAVNRIPFMYGENTVIGAIVRMSLPANLPEGYKVGVFREVRNESYYTDTCSKIAWLDV